MTTATFLGTGTSVGVPVIGCDCAVCSSRHPGNTRTRCSLHLQTPELSLLVDSGPDLREQALREDLRQVDAIIYTHSHLDHVAGFDELRAFCWRREAPLPLYAGEETLTVLGRMFPWAMENTQRNYVRIDTRSLTDTCKIADLAVTPVLVEHPSVETFGFRFDLPGGQRLAYIPDVKRIPAESRPLLAGLDVLIIDALRIEDHPTHMSLSEALETVDELQPAQTVFTHLAHEIDFEAVSAELPPRTALACDGLKLRFDGKSGCAMVPPFPL